MPKVTFIEDSGEEKQVEVAIGESLMQAAVNNMIEGIIGECGGSCVCATCHCFIDDDWRERVGPTNEAEDDMLSYEDSRQENSRLGCQVKMTEELDGLVVRLPASQY